MVHTTEWANLDIMGESGYYWLDNSYGHNGVDLGQKYIEIKSNYVNDFLGTASVGNGLGASIRCMRY